MKYEPYIIKDRDDPLDLNIVDRSTASVNILRATPATDSKRTAPFNIAISFHESFHS
jgi:hypothetical protein